MTWPGTFPIVLRRIRAAAEIAERCTYTIPVGHRIVPPRLADTGGAFAQLRELTLRGSPAALPGYHPRTAGPARLELGIIGQKGFADYFLVVRDIVGMDRPIAAGARSQIRW